MSSVTQARRLGLSRMKTRPADFRIELGYLRDNLLAAIQAKKSSLFQGGLEI